MKKLQVIEPSVIRLTSEETRALMRVALNSPAPLPYSGRGIMELGLVVKNRSGNEEKKRAKKRIEHLKQKLSGGVSYSEAVSLTSEISRLERLSAGRSEPLFRLSKAGESLVKTITIRRR